MWINEINDSNDKRNGKRNEAYSAIINLYYPWSGIVLFEGLHGIGKNVYCNL